jgi:hypothetical protein
VRGRLGSRASLPGILSAAERGTSEAESKDADIDQCRPSTALVPRPLRVLRIDGEPDAIVCIGVLKAVPHSSLCAMIGLPLIGKRSPVWHQWYVPPGTSDRRRDEPARESAMRPEYGFLAAVACGTIPYFAALSLVRRALGRGWGLGWQWMVDLPPLAYFIAVSLPMCVLMLTEKVAFSFRRLGFDWAQMGRELLDELPGYAIVFLGFAVWSAWAQWRGWKPQLPPQA